MRLRRRLWCLQCQLHCRSSSLLLQQLTGALHNVENDGVKALVPQLLRNKLSPPDTADACDPDPKEGPMLLADAHEVSALRNQMKKLERQLETLAMPKEELPPPPTIPHQLGPAIMDGRDVGRKQLDQHLLESAVPGNPPRRKCMATSSVLHPVERKPVVGKHPHPTAKGPPPHTGPSRNTHPG